MAASEVYCVLWAKSRGVEAPLEKQDWVAEIYEELWG
jgi:hypothetical protein